MPRGHPPPQPHVDVTAAMDERPHERGVLLRVLPGDAGQGSGRALPDGAGDPFGEIAI